MTGTGTNTYLIDGGQGHVAVVDPGPDEPEHLAAILAETQRIGRVEAILVTHGHLDHLPAARPLAESTGAPVCGHGRLPGVDRALREGQPLHIGNIELRPLETPGHTDDSLCYWLPGLAALFTGDLVAGVGTVVVDESPGGLGRYMASLERLALLGELTIYPGHGPVAEDGQAKIAEYIEHRRTRERQVLQALADVPGRTVEELVASIYADVPAVLTPMAARNVRAQLGKLRDEARVREQSGRWFLP